MDCRGRRIDDIVTVYDSDCLVLFSFRDRIAYIKELQEMKCNELMEKYGVEENTCMANLLAYLASRINFEGGEKEHLFYSSFFNEKGLNKWPREDIRENLKKLESLGIIDIVGFGDVEEYFRSFVDEIEGISVNLKVAYEKFLDAVSGHEKIIIPKESLSNEEFKAMISPSDPRIYISIGSMSEDEFQSLERVENVLIEKVDLRNVDKDMRMTVAAAAYRRFKDAYIKEKPRGYSQEERTDLIERVKTGVKVNHHILGAYLAGSNVISQRRKKSDLDIVLKRSRCPGYDKCSFYKEKELDIFCFTEDEFEELKRRGALLISNVLPLF